MKRVVVRLAFVAVAAFGLLSCADEVSLHELQIVNNSSIAVERVGLGFTGIKSRAFAPPDLEVTVSVPAGQTKTVELTLAPSTRYYILFIHNDTEGKDIIWAGSTASFEYVRLSPGGSSSCTVDHGVANCAAGENAATPYVHRWAP